MEQIKAIFWIYKTSLVRTVELVRSNLAIILAPIAYSLILSAAALLAAPFGIIGGFVMGLVLAACASSGLYLIDNVVRMGKAIPQDFVKGFSVYLWDVLTIAFIFWIPMRLLAQFAVTTPEGAVIYLGVQILLYIIFNPVPELIYQSRLSGLALLSASYQFIVENWLEWLLPNLLVAVAGYLLRFWIYRAGCSLAFFSSVFSSGSGVWSFPDFSDDFSRPPFYGA